MTEPEPIPACDDFDLLVGAALRHRLEDLAEAAGACRGVEPVLAVRGFRALASDAAQVLAPELRPSFRAFCEPLLDRALRDAGDDAV
jgi:hypothetical protein